MKVRSVTPMRVAKIGYLVVSTAFCAAGVFLIAKSDLSAVLLGRALGIAMIIFGIFKIIGYFSKDLFRLAFQYDFEPGVVLILLGLVTLIKPFDVMHFIFITMGLAILTESLLKLRIAREAKKFGIEQWWLILAFSIVTTSIGVPLIIRPWESARAMTVLLGAALLSEGIMNLCVTLSTVKIVKNQYPDIVEDDMEMEDPL